MEATGIIVLAVFVVTILSSMGGRVPSDRPSLPQQNQTIQIDISTLPPATYTQSYDSETEGAVIRYVALKAKKVSVDDARRMSEAIMRYSQQYDVNPKLLTGMIERESGFNPECVSSSNAQGLGQLLPSTASHIGIRDPFDIDEGVKGAALYLRMMMERWPGYPNQVALALASYAEGPNQVSRSGGAYTDATAGYIRDIVNITNSIR
jgi:soluble lytic murein transglycosylase-like protein